MGEIGVVLDQILALFAKVTVLISAWLTLLPF
jgi:hypothetical protein